MASEDGITWTELSIRLVERSVAGLAVEAGASYWIYGPNIGGGGIGIEVDSTTILWISEDGTSWQPLDLGFMSPNARQHLSGASCRSRWRKDTRPCSSAAASSFESGSVHIAGNFIYVHVPESAAQDWIAIVEMP